MAFKLSTKNKKAAQYFAAGMASMLVLSGVVGTGGYVLFERHQQAELSEANAKVADMKKWASKSAQGWALKQDVKSGEKITEEMLQKVALPPAAASSGGQADILDMVNHYVKLDLPKNTVLYKQFVFADQELTKDLRNVDWSFIALPKKIQKDDYVDIRIQFPNGNDYIVVSHFKVEDLTAAGTIFGKINEGQILTMSSAMVDAWLNDAKIYALTYVDKNMQEAAKVTYPVKQNVLELIETSPNVVNIAETTLENRRSSLDSANSSLTIEQKNKILQARDGQEQNERQKQQEAQQQAQIQSQQQTPTQPTQNNIIGGGSQ